MLLVLEVPGGLQKDFELDSPPPKDPSLTTVLMPLAVLSCGLCVRLRQLPDLGEERKLRTSILNDEKT